MRAAAAGEIWKKSKGSSDLALHAEQCSAATAATADHRQLTTLTASSSSRVNLMGLLLP